MVLLVIVFGAGVVGIIYEIAAAEPASGGFAQLAERHDDVAAVGAILTRDIDVVDRGVDHLPAHTHPQATATRSTVPRISPSAAWGR